MATWRKAKLVALRTADGLMEVNPGVDIGTDYEVDVESIRERRFWNKRKGVEHRKQIVTARNSAGRGYFPVELLKIEGAS